MRLKDLREDNDLTQEQLAMLLNCKRNTYSQYENEKRQIPIDALIGGGIQEAHARLCAAVLADYSLPA